MKPIICIYCEGNDTKIVALNKEKEKISVLKATSFDFIQPLLDVEGDLSELSIEDEEFSLEGTAEKAAFGSDLNVSNLTQINAALKDLNLKNSLFIPALTEPSIHYHIFEGSVKDKSSKVVQNIIDDIQQTKNVVIDKENLGYVELADKDLLAVFLSGEVGCIQLINSLARYNKKRYYKITTVKSAEISLAYYVAKRKKFFPDDHSLIVYIGKEYSKLIFLHGRKLKHIGSTLDIGTQNLHTYDVYFSKILLEMENGGISSLDNIIVCGEDDSENLILSFYGTFPEANVSRLEFDDLDTSLLKSSSPEKLSAFSVPLAVAADYFDELAEEHTGINLLPKYVKDEQKPFQFAWHGYLILPLLFITALFLTQNILKNNKEVSLLNTQIAEQTIRVRQNQAILDQISSLESNINNFDQTKAILDSASVGADVWNNVLSRISGFFAVKKNIWLTKFTTDGNNVVLDGFSLSKNDLTEFAYSIKSAELKGVFNETLREKKSFKFKLIFNLSSYHKAD